MQTAPKTLCLKQEGMFPSPVLFMHCLGSDRSNGHSQQKIEGQGIAKHRPTTIPMLVLLHAELPAFLGNQSIPNTGLRRKPSVNKWYDKQISPARPKCFLILPKQLGLLVYGNGQNIIGNICYQIPGFEQVTVPSSNTHRDCSDKSNDRCH
jgi:hypothetical protein